MGALPPKPLGFVGDFTPKPPTICSTYFWIGFLYPTGSQVSLISVSESDSQKKASQQKKCVRSEVSKITGNMRNALEWIF